MKTIGMVCVTALQSAWRARKTRRLESLGGAKTPKAPGVSLVTMDHTQRVGALRQCYREPLGTVITKGPAAGIRATEPSSALVTGGDARK